MKKGFTLIELLVVILIVALLLAIVVPYLARAKEEARRVCCASFLHQFAIAANAYSQDHDDYLPSFPSPSGPHIHDIAEEFMIYMNKNYGLNHKDFFCPSIPPQGVAMGLSYHERNESAHRVIGYNYWVPRFVTNYNMEIPPKQTISTFTVIDTEIFSAPKKILDSLGKYNPIMTD